MKKFCAWYALVFLFFLEYPFAARPSSLSYPLQNGWHETAGNEGKTKIFQDQSVFRSGANSQGLSWWHPWSKSARADRSLWQWTGQSFRPYRSSEKRLASRNNMSERSSLGSSPPWCEWQWFAHAPKTRGLSAKVTAWFRNGSHSHLRASERLLAKAGGWTCEGPLQWTLPHLDRIWCPWWSFSSRR